MESILLGILGLLAGLVIGYVVRGRSATAGAAPRISDEDLSRLRSDLAVAQTRAAECEALKENERGLRMENTELTRRLAEAQGDLKQQNEIRTRLAETESQLAHSAQTLTRITAECARLNTELEQLSRLKQEYTQLAERYQKTREDLAECKAQLEAQRAQNETHAQMIEELKAELKRDFKSLAGEALKENNEESRAQNRLQLESILNPLKENIHAFKEVVSANSKETQTERDKLKFHLDALAAQTLTLGQEAHNLTAALKGNNKAQGNWGEMILATLLERAGLERNLQYSVQEYAHNEDGERIIPDYIVNLPNNQGRIIIDSKVSLKAYTELHGAADASEAAVLTKSICDSLRGHADGLAKKKYESMENAFNSVFMFVPVEGAFIEAMRHDTDLWFDAYKKNVFIISPTNLMLTMNIVMDLWRRSEQEKNAREIAERATRMYDKMNSVVKSLKEVGAKLDGANRAYANAYNQLSAGKGSLLSSFEKMRKLGNLQVKDTLPLPDPEEPEVIESSEDIRETAGRLVEHAAARSLDGEVFNNPAQPEA